MRRLASGRARRRLLAWRRYAARNDRMVGDQWKRRLGHPMRTNPGFFRAEGWDTDAWNLALRHGS